MKPADEKRITAKLAKLMGLMCVRNTRIEAIHAGVAPITKTGDYSDVVVLDAEGRKIPWAEVAHFDDDAMRDLMRQIVNRLYTFQLKSDDLEFGKLMDRWASIAQAWDEPELDEGLFRKFEKNEGMVDD